MLGMMQPSRNSLPFTNPRIKDGLPTCFQKLKISPAGISTLFNLRDATRMFCTFPTVRILFCSLSLLHNGQTDSANTENFSMMLPFGNLEVLFSLFSILRLNL